MDLKMFGLERNPFKNAPGSTSFYSSVNHKKLLDSLLLGLRERYGLHLILGENGTGKTTLCRFIQLAYAHEFDLGYLGNPFVTDHEFLRHVLTEFGVPHEPTATNKELMDAFGRHLAQQFAKGRTVALFIDEAHHLDRSIFDQLLVMANMQQGGVPMVQIVLCGLPELLGVLAKPGMGSLNQRIGTRTMLAPLSLEETAKYIRYRLEAAKSRDLSLFAPKAVKIIWKATGGKPRLINHLSRLSLERAAGEGRHAISPAVVKAALKGFGLYQPVRSRGLPGARSPDAGPARADAAEGAVRGDARRPGRLGVGHLRPRAREQIRAHPRAARPGRRAARTRRNPRGLSCRLPCPPSCPRPTRSRWRS